MVAERGIGITHLQVIQQDRFVLAFAIAERAGSPS
jgi:hypothetical protein